MPIIGKTADTDYRPIISASLNKILFLCPSHRYSLEALSSWLVQECVCLWVLKVRGQDHMCTDVWML